MYLHPSRRSNRRGFTLIELLVVITILAVLAVMVVPRFFGAVDKAKVATAQSDISDIAKMLENFRLDVGRYPTTEEGLNALRVQPSGADGWRGPYAGKDLPNDPWQHPYVYQNPGSHGDDSYYLASYGSDGVKGGTDSAADIEEDN